MLIEHAELIVALLFGIMGFIIAFFLTATINIIIFGGLTYAIFKALASLNFKTDWAVFNRFVGILSDLGETVWELVTGMINNANDIALIVFIFGSAFGLFMKKHHS